MEFLEPLLPVICLLVFFVSQALVSVLGPMGAVPFVIVYYLVPGCDGGIGYP
jgi:hypothetical protein